MNTPSSTESPRYICPVCQLPLSLTNNTLRCDKNHSYDKAKQGYWNLLLVQRKRSKDPGDNPEMVAARTNFLNHGFYQPLANRVCALAKELTKDCSPCSVLDMGCGEGFYTAQIAKTLTQATVYGLDISKHAIRAATKRTRHHIDNMHWLVASGAQIPLPAHSQDLLVVMFSRLMPLHFSQALNPNGKLILVWPATEHLIELRRIIYDEIKPSTFDPISELNEHFNVDNSERLTFTFSLDSRESLDALLGMTPHSQRISEDARERLINQGDVNLTFDVHIGTFSPR